MTITFITFMCLSITGFSNLFTNESDRKFVSHPSNSKANWFRMIVSLIIQLIIQTGYISSRVMEAIESLISTNSQTEPNKNEQILEHFAS